MKNNNDINCENPVVNIYRNTIDNSGKYFVKFLKPSIVKGRIVFNLNFFNLNNYINLINNLKVSFDIITIFSITNDSESKPASDNYIVIDSRFKDMAIPLFNEYGFDVDYAGKAEDILKNNTFTEEEYNREVELDFFINRLYGTN